jgi:hypothetical protein
MGEAQRTLSLDGLANSHQPMTQFCGVLESFFSSCKAVKGAGCRLRENSLLESDFSKSGSATSFALCIRARLQSCHLGHNGQGFSPCQGQIGAEIPRERGTGAEAQLFFALYGTTEVVP